MEIALIVLIFLMTIVILALVIRRQRGQQPDVTRLDNRLDSLNQRLGQVVDQASTYQNTISAVQQTLGGLKEASKNILEVGQDMRKLQDVLAAPKLRGGLGEFLLGDLLRQILPEGIYETQYTFRNGHRVDAIIRLTNGVVPIDAKFPLESFRRLTGNPDDTHALWREFRNDVKRHIDDIARSYICPGETLDFALMYIPAENVYYEVMLKQEEQESIIEYAWGKRVIPTSPNSFYAYLQVIALGLRGLQIEGNARVMLDSLTRLKGDFDKFADDYRLIGTHLNRASAKYSEALPKLDSLQRTLPGQGPYTPRIEGTQPSETADAGKTALEWEYKPARRKRGRSGKQSSGPV